MELVGLVEEGGELVEDEEVAGWVEEGEVGDWVEEGTEEVVEDAGGV